MRLPLATDFKTRTSAPDKDARQKNSYIEVKGDQSIVRKRPCAQGGIATGTGIAQGGFGFTINGTPYVVSLWGDTPVTSPDGGGWTNGSTYAAGGSGPDAPVYATWNPLDKGADVILSDGDLTASFPVMANNELVRSTISKSTGKWYWEITLNNVGDTTVSLVTGVQGDGSVDSYIGGPPNGWGHTYSIVGTACNATGNSTKYHNGGFSCFGVNVSSGNIIGFALDLDAGNIGVYINGSYQGIMYSGISGTVFAGMSTDISSAQTTTVNGTANFGASPFSYTVPSGYNSGLYA